MSATSSKLQRTPRALGALLVLLLLALAIPASAEDAARRVVLTLLVNDTTKKDDAESIEAARLRKQRIAEEAVRRLRTRFEAAGIKHADVLITEALHIQLALITREDRRWIEGLVLAPGELAVRPVLRVGDEWAAAGSHIPDVMELRQEEGSMDPRAGYIWSPSSAPLRAFVKAHAPKHGATMIVPEGAGWRTLTLGDPVISHHDIRRVSVEQDSMGGSWARITLAPSVQTRWDEADPTATSGWAVVLDGEVIERVTHAPPESLRAELRLRCPATSAALSAQRACVGQIAGRLASPIPISLTPYKFEETR
jgi:hypothetical protein